MAAQPRADPYRARRCGGRGVDVTRDAQNRRLAQTPLGYAHRGGRRRNRARKAQASIFAVWLTVVAVLLLLINGPVAGHEKMALVLLTAPLGIIGVAAILAAFRIPFGFVAMLGVIALAGMIIHQFGDPGGADRYHDLQARRPACGTAIVGSCRAPPAADPAHRPGRHPGSHGAADPLGLLGPHGLVDHGRPFCRHLLTLLFLPAPHPAGMGRASRKASDCWRTPRNSPLRSNNSPLAGALALVSGSLALDLVGATPRRRGYDPARPPPGRWWLGRRRVQGAALLLPQMNFPPVIRTSAIRPRSACRRCSPRPHQERGFGHRASGGGAAFPAALQRQGERRQKLPAEQTEHAEVSYRNADQDPIQRVAGPKRAAGQEALRVNQAERPPSACSGTGPGALRRRPRQDHRAAESQVCYDAVLARRSPPSTWLAPPVPRGDWRPRRPVMEVRSNLAVPPQPENLASWQARGMAEKPGADQAERMTIASAEIGKC